MIKYYCDRCNAEINANQYAVLPKIYQYLEDREWNNAIFEEKRECVICVDCMRRYNAFLGGKLLIDEKG